MLDADARRRIVEAARRLCGVPYDAGHRNKSWRNLAARPTALDCSGLVCRVACEALGHSVGTLAQDAEWLLDHLVIVDQPEMGDLVGYYRDVTKEDGVGDYRWPNGADLVAANFGDDEKPPPLWHVMIFVGSGTVVGACDLADAVTERALLYDTESRWDVRRWRLIAAPVVPSAPYRRLQLRSAR